MRQSGKAEGQSASLLFLRFMVRSRVDQTNRHRLGERHHAFEWNATLGAELAHLSFSAIDAVLHSGRGDVRRQDLAEQLAEHRFIVKREVKAIALQPALAGENVSAPVVGLFETSFLGGGDDRVLERHRDGTFRAPRAPGAREWGMPFFELRHFAAAKARIWIDDLVSGRVRSFAEIARSEGKVERHIRLLAPLAFLPPRTLAAIANGTFRQDVTVTALARAVPFSWELQS
jgi:hypothetical protein